MLLLSFFVNELIDKNVEFFFLGIEKINCYVGK